MRARPVPAQTPCSPRRARSRPPRKRRSTRSSPAGSPAQPRSDATRPAGARPPLAADIAGEIAGRKARLPKRTRADRQPVEQLDMHKAVAPAALDQLARHEPANREVRVQTVPARMPLRHPHIRKPPLSNPRAQLAKEPAQIAAQPHRVMATLAPVGQRAEPVQPVRRRITPDLRPRPPTRFQRPGTASPTTAPYVVSSTRLCRAARTDSLRIAT